MCGSPDIPAPDPAMGEAAKKQVNLAYRQFEEYYKKGGDRDFNRSVMNQALGIYKKGSDRADQLQQYQLAQAQRNDDRYWNVAVPYEDRLLEQVEEMDTDAYRDAQVNRALADTQMQVDSARQQGIRSMNRRGANPMSGAYAGMMNDGGRAQALAMATAANKTRLAAQQVGLSNKMQMYGGMKGLAGLGATSAQLALGAGSQMMQGAGGMQNAVSSAFGNDNAAYAGVNAGISSGLSGYNSYYANQLTGARIAAENDPFNTILGSVAGAGMSAMLSDRRLKTDIVPVGRLANGLTVYRYRMKSGGPFMIGVMADEVAQLVPDAYLRGGAGGGYDAVDYSKL